jgi:hypothetical protein
MMMILLLVRTEKERIIDRTRVRRSKEGVFY